MSGADLAGLALIAVALIVACPLLGRYLAAVFGDGPAPGDRWLVPLERRVLGWCGIDAQREQEWRAYAFSLLAFSGVSIVGLYALQRVQGIGLLNPDGRGAVDPVVAWNTAVSFVTNTNWQSYSGESTMSHLTQMLGLTVQNFVSPAVGLAVAVALIRGLVRSRSGSLGNFWSDLFRGVVRVLLPLSAVTAGLLVAGGVVQNLRGVSLVRTLEGAVQSIPGGPVAGQVAIKMLGTNGGGFFGANSAHPFENPGAAIGLLQIVLMLLVPFALPFAFGRLVGDRRQGYVVVAAMLTLFTVSAGVSLWAEHQPVAALGAASVSDSGSPEGKEMRFSTAACAVYSSATTSTSTGSVNCAHDSLSAAAGGVALVNMMLGEVSPGGIGAGLYGMLVFVLTAVFLAGLMVGRTPEFLGKRIQSAEVKLVVCYILVVPAVVLPLAAISVLTEMGRGAQVGQGPHGLTQIVYAFASAGNNNGSSFGGLNVTNAWYQIGTGVAMFVGRFGLMIPTLAIAGALGRRQKVPPTAGTFPTGTPLFTVLLIGVVVIVVGLTYFPVLALGPVVEHLAR